VKLNNFFKLIVSILLCQAVGIGGAFFTSPAVSSSWYRALEKPALNPPSWVFSPVWITLYFLMGVALFLVWRASGERRKIKMALSVFGIQLFFNALWSVIFFGWQNLGWALADIVALGLAIVWTIFVFRKISKTAGYLLAPYLLWVGFAGYLNYALWILN